jgi:two-component system response regulator AtoC
MANVLIADDEANLRKVLRTLLERDGHRTVCVADGRAAVAALKTVAIDIVITDLKMPKMTGLELLQVAKQQYPGLPVILITAHGTVDTAVSALKMGAFDYITKPFERDELKLAVRKAAAVRMTLASRLQDAGDPRGRFRIIGQSKRMAEIYTVIEKVASTPTTVLIGGESGTGKELVASALHEASPRRDKPFIKVNCSAIPKDLMESEFFGYEQGAFTGAVAAKPGRFELADGGTLFLDEISEIPNSMQVKLLRALQESEFERVGGVRTLKVDVRVIAASNRDLTAHIASGQFREDLYYRLNVVPIALPALRERPEDIPLLTDHFLEKCSRRLDKAPCVLTEGAMAALATYSWPGNIRELENVIERTLLFSEDATIDIGDLPEEVRRGTPAGANVASTPLVPMPALTPHDTAGQASMRDIVRQATSHLERDLILQALDETQGNITRAAYLLKISRKGLQNKMKDFHLRESDTPR